MRCLTLRQSSTHRVQQGPPLRGRKLRHLATLLFDKTRRQSPREGRVHCKWHDNHENTMIMSWWCGDNDNDCAVGCDCKGGWQRRQMQMLGLVCSHVTRHNEIPPARFSQMHVLDSGITKLNVVAIGSNAEKKKSLGCAIHHHPPSSTIIHHHPPTSISKLDSQAVSGSEAFNLQFPVVRLAFLSKTTSQKVLSKDRFNQIDRAGGREASAACGSKIPKWGYW